jgi:hypothetical protein
VPVPEFVRRAIAYPPNVYHWNGYGWQNLGALDRGVSGEWRWVQTPVAQYSPFALADANNGPTSITLRTFAARSAQPVAWLVVSVVMLGAATVVFKRKR